MTDFVTRFAPSPTGRLHLGHAASAFHVWHAAAKSGGRVLLRIEDTDLGRCKPEYTEAIFEDLNWLGLEWDGPVRIQSEHFDDYDKVVERLTGLGLTYRCFRTRSELADEGVAPGTPFTGNALPPGEQAERLERGDAWTWRLSLAACRDQLGPEYENLSFRLLTLSGEEQTVKACPDLHGDINLTRKDSPTAYHLAATHDDTLQGITHVIRGEDLAGAAHIHTLIQRLMDWLQPVYTHHPLIMGPDGKKLAKRLKSQSLASLRADGLSPSDIRRMAGV